MIVIRRSVRDRKQEQMMQAVNNARSKYGEKELLNRLNNAQSQGLNVQDPKVFLSVINAQASSGNQPFTRRRKTKSGKIVVEVVRR